MSTLQGALTAQLINSLIPSCWESLPIVPQILMHGICVSLIPVLLRRPLWCPWVMTPTAVTSVVTSEVSLSYDTYCGDLELCHLLRWPRVMPPTEVTSSYATYWGDLELCHLLRWPRVMPPTEVTSSYATYWGDLELCHLLRWPRVMPPTAVTSEVFLSYDALTAVNSVMSLSYDTYCGDLWGVLELWHLPWWPVRCSSIMTPLNNVFWIIDWPIKSQLMKIGVGDIRVSEISIFSYIFWPFTKWLHVFFSETACPCGVISKANKETAVALRLDAWRKVLTIASADHTFRFPLYGQLPWNQSWKNCHWIMQTVVVGFINSIMSRSFIHYARWTRCQCWYEQCC